MVSLRTQSCATLARLRVSRNSSTLLLLGFREVARVGSGTTPPQRSLRSSPPQIGVLSSVSDYMWSSLQLLTSLVKAQVPIISIDIWEHVRPRFPYRFTHGWCFIPGLLSSGMLLRNLNVPLTDLCSCPSIETSGRHMSPVSAPL